MDVLCTTLADRCPDARCRALVPPNLAYIHIHIYIYTYIYRYQYMYIYIYIRGSCLLLLWPQNTDLFQLPLPAENTNHLRLLGCCPPRQQNDDVPVQSSRSLLLCCHSPLEFPIPNCRSWKLLVHILRDLNFRHAKSWNNSSGQKQSAFGVTSFIREQNLLRMSHHGWFCNVQAW